MLDVICSCKMFRNSKDKDNVLATLKNPTNSELVVQLQSYLDPQYRKKKDKPDMDDTKVSDKELVSDDPTNVTTDSTATTGNSALGFSEAGETISKIDEVPDEVPLPDTNSDPGDNTNADVQDDDGNVNSSISASTSLNSSVPVVSGDSLKGLLNTSEDTEGVSRIRITDDEVWIYYEDKKNLNNIMGSVIELLASANYCCLEFNRLARTDNAIVFQLYPTGSSSSTQVGESNG